MQKFTEKEQEEFDAQKVSAFKEIEEKYREQKTKLQEIIARQNYKQEDFLPSGEKTFTKEQKAEASNKVKEANTNLKKGKDKARNPLKELEDIISREARALLKERFFYPIFMYEAEKVGITATGESDYNELYPNDNKPPGTEKTCLELYQEFRNNSDEFLLV